MAKMTLYTGSDDSLDEPEGETCWTPLAEYDPHDPESLQKAREAVRDHFSLTYLPVLCNEPERSWYAGLLEAAGRFFSARRQPAAADLSMNTGGA